MWKYFEDTTSPLSHNLRSEVQLVIPSAVNTLRKIDETNSYERETIIPEIPRMTQSLSL